MLLQHTATPLNRYSFWHCGVKKTQFLSSQKANRTKGEKMNVLLDVIRAVKDARQSNGGKDINCGGEGTLLDVRKGNLRKEGPV